MATYKYEGPVETFGRCIAHKWVAYTTAVSEKKAISNIMFRLGINKWDLYCGWEGDGGRSICFTATAIQK